MTHPCIDIVLAAFNGEEFIKQQVESIQNNKKYKELVSRFIVVDDGSTDGTECIIAEMMKRDSKIEWAVNKSVNKGAKGNFNFGLSLVTSHYVMLSDQDDIWHRDKIVKSYQSICSLPQDMPILLFTDKRVVDRHLNELEPSYLKMRRFPENWHGEMQSLIQENVASGCTMMFNQALLIKALPIESGAFMHDWWLILVAKTMGKVVLLNEPLIDYRQHDNNEIGIRNYSLWFLTKHFFHLLAKFEKNFWCTVGQAELLAKKFDSEELRSVPFTQLNHYGYIKRLWLFFTGELKQHTWKGQIALFCTLLKSKKRSN